MISPAGGSWASKSSTVVSLRAGSLAIMSSSAASVVGSMGAGGKKSRSFKESHHSGNGS